VSRTAIGAWLPVVVDAACLGAIPGECRVVRSDGHGLHWWHGSQGAEEHGGTEAIGVPSPLESMTSGHRHGSQAGRDARDGRRLAGTLSAPTSR
jgi:hypothetical protein